MYILNYDNVERSSRYLITSHGGNHDVTRYLCACRIMFIIVRSNNNTRPVERQKVDRKRKKQTADEG